ncbi:hypothetical protein AOQ84DRAFT_426521 [Glonium stellatum]|uniref:Uncharacterized protein n=1 Tax=Glonium stellatum TaxID=574774 RepID=A0A8E2F5A8_9PEZI|nr:hypothetical protein AOQ84DRAFT_426521 [Glonium stellatum]
MAESHQPPANPLDTKVRTNEIVESFRRMKKERDIWQKMTMQLNQALEEAFDQRDQLQSLLVATQAELENLRRYHGANSIPVNPPSVALDKWLAQDWISTSFTRKHLSEPERMFTEGSYQEALVYLDSLLGTVISLELRAEAQLLKATILRACRMGAKALEQCEEVIVSCNRNPSMHCIRGKANFYKGICMFDVKNFDQARIAFTPVDSTEFFAPKAAAWKQRCEEEQRSAILLEASRVPEEHSRFLAKRAGLRNSPRKENYDTEDEQDVRIFLDRLGVPRFRESPLDNMLVVKYSSEKLSILTNVQSNC